MLTSPAPLRHSIFASLLEIESRNAETLGFHQNYNNHASLIEVIECSHCHGAKEAKMIITLLLAMLLFC